MFRTIAVAVALGGIGTYLGTKYPDAVQNAVDSGRTQLGVEDIQIKPEHAAAGLACLLGVLLGAQSIGGRLLSSVGEWRHKRNIENGLLGSADLMKFGDSRCALWLYDFRRPGLDVQAFLNYCHVSGRLAMAKYFSSQKAFDATLNEAKVIHQRLVAVCTKLLSNDPRQWTKFKSVEHGENVRTVLSQLTSIAPGLAAVTMDNYGSTA